MQHQDSARYLEFSLLRTLREGIAEEDTDGEGKFGLVPNSAHPDEALSQNTHNTNAHQEMPSHPLLSRSAQFSGVDKRLTADPSNSEVAQDKVPQLRLAKQLRNQYLQRQRHTTKLTR